VAALTEPALDEILAFCAEDPIERVFLEDVARRGLGRFTGLAEDGGLRAPLSTSARTSCRLAPAAARSRASTAARRPGS
jgi:hypothetical protein